jgi:hypothetical protein
MHYVLDMKIDSNQTKMKKIRNISNKIKSYFTEKYHIYKIVLQPEFTKEDVKLDSEKCFLDMNLDSVDNHNKKPCNHHQH